jgi:hypothetical protein
VDRCVVRRQQVGVPLRGRLGREYLADQSTPRSRFDQVGAFDQKKSAPATGDVSVQFDRGDNPGRSFSEHRVRLRSDCPAPPRAVSARIVTGPVSPGEVRRPLRTAR